MGRWKQGVREGGEEAQRQMEQLAARGDFERAALVCLQAFDDQNDLEWLEKADNLYLTANNRLQAALVRRKMGETRIELQQWTEGENDLKHYLKTAKELRDDHEQQRALTTLGRFYLEQSRSTATTSLRIISLQKADKYCKEALAAVQRIVSCSRDERVKMRLGVLRNQFLIKQELVDADESNSNAVQETLDVLDKYEKLAFNEGFKQDKFDVLLQKGVFLSKFVNKHKEAIENLDKAASLWVTFKNRMGQKEAKDKLRDVLIELTAALVRAKNFRRAHDAHLALLKHCSHIENANKDDSRRDINDEESNDDNQLNSLYCLRKIAEASELLSSHSLSTREQVKQFELIADMLTDLQSFPSQALEYYERAFTLAKEHSENNKENTSDGIDEKPLLESMASSAMDTGDYSTAYTHFTNLVTRFKGNNLKLHKLFKLMLECIDKDSHCKDDRMEQLGQLARDLFEKEGNESKMFHVLALQLVIASYLEPCLKETMESKIRNSATKHDLDLKQLKHFVENMDNNEFEESEEVNPEKVELRETDIRKMSYFYPEQMANLLQLANNEDNSIRRQHFRPVRNEKGETRLHTKCQKPGNETEIQALIAQGYNVNDCDNGGFKSLQEAAVNGHLSYIKILVEHGAKVNAQSDSGETALIDAAANGFFDIALYLIDKGAKPELQDNDGWTALCHLQNYAQRKSKEMTREEMSMCDEVGARMQIHFDKLSQSGQTIFTKEKKEKSTIFADSDEFLEEDCKTSLKRQSNTTNREPRKRKRREKEEASFLSSFLPKRVVRERNDDWIEATMANVEHDDESVTDHSRHLPIATETTNRNNTCVRSASSFEIASRPLSTSSPSPAVSENITPTTTSVNVEGEDVSGSGAAPSPSSARVSLGSFRVRARIEGRVLVVPVATPTSAMVSHLSSLILKRFVSAQNRGQNGCNVARRLPRQLRLVCGGAELDDNDCVASVLAHNDEVDALVVDWAHLDPTDLYEQACEKHQGDERVKFVPEIAEMLSTHQSKKSSSNEDSLDLSRLHLNELRLSPVLSVVTLCYDHLTELDLSRNFVDDICLKMICRDGASVLGRLTKLDLSFNALTNVDAFVNVIDGKWRLKGLYLDFNFLRDRSSDSILRLLGQSVQLEQLGIRANGLTNNFFDPLQSWIQILKARPGMNIRVRKRNDICVETLEAITTVTETKLE